jgi:multidrug efflux pump subunit AcrA (membrane-fusion protein)
MPGTNVRATVDTVPQPVTAIVRQVSPTVDPASGMIVVEAELPSDEALISRLRPGLAASVQ